MTRKSPHAWLTLFVTLALLGFAPNAPAKAPAKTIALPAGVERGPSMGGISEFRLANGLKVLLMPDQARDKTLVNITYLVGSRHEGYGETGMAHLLEHMLFKGTARVPDAKGELMKYGARPNGSTYYDRTNYFEVFQAGEKTLGAMLAFEADRMVNARVAQKDLESEMTVVRSEFERGENDPDDLLDNRVAATAYLWHNYGRDVIGTRSDIENVPIQRLQAFYRYYYQPDNAVLVIAGRFDPARALKMTVDHFGRIPKPKRTLLPTYTREPAQDGEREVILRRAGKVQMVEASYHIPPGSHPDYVPVDILTQILVMQPNGRLHDNLVETGLAASVAGYNLQLREPGTLRIGANVPAELSLEKARDTLLATAEGFEKNPVTDEEVERARAKLGKEMDLYLTDTFRVAQGLSEFIGMGDWRLMFLYNDQLAKVKREDVQRVATTYLRRANRTLGLFYPSDDFQTVATPEPPDTEALLKNFSPTDELALGENFDTSPQNIQSRLIRKTLPSGMKLLMLPKKNRGATVLAGLTLHWGTEESKNNWRAACNLSGVMLSRGTELHTRAQLRDELDRLRANVAVGLENASIST
ncbi:MAG TPA: pitrilysin family protein, partial [Burkholderiales bacterium]|nr:pitrilysin family protein [Burkholderiales bacterium]